MPRAPSIELARAADGARCFEVLGLRSEQRQALAAWAPDDARWPELLRVAVACDGMEDRPAMLGAYSLVGERPRFTPRFALQAHLRYRVEFRPERLATAGGSQASASGSVMKEFEVAPADDLPATEVAAVYPSAAALPENLLKFYLHFSAPMSRGEAYERIHLLGADGRSIERAFLELGEELWDPAGRRFTLFFDPGRIKRGLKPREELGPALESGRRYTLVVDAAWRDAADRPLAAEFRKSFDVGPPDDQPPDAKSWHIEVPSAGTLDPLLARFPEPLDHALLQRLLSVVDCDGATIEGEVATDQKETRWQFRPYEPWRPGAYQLLADTVLEDLVGNNLARPFEVDIQRPVTREVPRQTVALGFEIPCSNARPTH
ncbi:MAG TPA: hypothetical protein VMV69_03915 [Pirellulales bacterium]|nr:hypothetical protein [Pirellulales bacterium]